MFDNIKIEKRCIQIQEAHSEREKNIPIKLHNTITVLGDDFCGLDGIR